jgi:hypothetical protein
MHDLFCWLEVEIKHVKYIGCLCLNQDNSVKNGTNLVSEMIGRSSERPPFIHPTAVLLGVQRPRRQQHHYMRLDIPAARTYQRFRT